MSVDLDLQPTVLCISFLIFSPTAIFCFHIFYVFIDFWIVLSTKFFNISTKFKLIMTFKSLLLLITINSYCCLLSFKNTSKPSQPPDPIKISSFLVATIVE